MTTPTQLPRNIYTASPFTIHLSIPPIPDITGSPTIRFRPPIPDITASPTIRFRSPIPDITASATIPFRPPIPDIPARRGNQPTLNVSPSPPVEIGKPVLFEVVLWQPPPPGWNLQYRFDFGDGTRTDWTSERQATHTYFSSGNGSTRSMSKLPRHTAIASCQPKQSTKMSMLSHRQIRHPARRLQLRSRPRQLPTHPRRLLLTLQSLQPCRQQLLSSARPLRPPLPSSKMLWLYIAVGFSLSSRSPI